MAIHPESKDGQACLVIEGEFIIYTVAEWRDGLFGKLAECSELEIAWPRFAGNGAQRRAQLTMRDG